MRPFRTCSLLLLLVGTVVSAQDIISDSLLIDGNYRTFHYVAPAKGSAPQRLVFVLHGSGGTGLARMQECASLLPLSGPEKVLFVFPDGYKRFWNECRKVATSEANLLDIDEGTFFTRMISRLSKQYRTDSTAAFAIGFSGGGHMAYKLALTMPARFPAVVAIVSNLPDSVNMDCIASAKPVSVMIVNGTADGVNPYNGGEVNVQNVKLGTVRSTESTLRYWSTLAGYTGEPVKDMMPDADTTNDTSIERYRFSAPGRKEVALLKMINGTHSAPKDLDIYREAWTFLKRQPTH